jgi:uncharacterized protein YyaL (SSP411 family)
VNRLADATSPYLLQHKDNPVDWWPWSEGAFAAARERDVPVLLSVGYAACHWCHVMAHESFEDERVAAFVNEHFVCIKVDREERPDVDAVYMEATQAMTGHGGWPMTCFLTPTAEPFFCGTYFPPADRGGMPSFLRVCASVVQAWTERREEIRASAVDVVRELQQTGAPPGGAEVTNDVLDAAAKRLSEEHDDQWGGFGSAPKFPPSMVLEFLLRHAARTGDTRSLDMVATTCERMARGGIYDQLAGGFARYSVDAHWVVPHFEKMLYDNAQLLRVHTHLWRATGDPLARRVALETSEFLLRDLRTAEGGFASALDADTDGVEGLTYAWTPAQLVEVLGEDDGRRAADLLSVTQAGTFEHGTSTLQLLEDPDDPEWWAATRSTLLAARRGRPQPGRDDKVVTSWNGLAVAALAETGSILGEPSLVAAAEACAEFVVSTHLVDGRLRRTSREGAVGAAVGVADDYGNLAEGLLSLHQATGAARWLQVARDLLDTATERFAAQDGGFHDTSDDAEQLFTRPRSAADNAEPSGQSALAGALLTCAALTGDPAMRGRAEAALAAAGDVAARDPRFGGWALAVAEAAVAGPLQVAVVGAGPEADALLEVVRRSPSPGLVLAHGEPDAPGVPLLEQRPLVEGRPAAYVCRGFVCDAPVTDVEGLSAALR